MSRHADEIMFHDQLLGEMGRRSPVVADLLGKNKTLFLNEINPNYGTAKLGLHTWRAYLMRTMKLETLRMIAAENGCVLFPVPVVGDVNSAESVRIQALRVSAANGAMTRTVLEITDDQSDAGAGITHDTELPLLIGSGNNLIEEGAFLMALGEAVAIRPEGERRLRARTVPPPERMPRGMRAVAR